MNMKQKLLMGLVATTLTAPVFADTAGDSQSISTSASEVYLIDIKSASGTTTSGDEDDSGANALTVSFTDPSSGKAAGLGLVRPTAATGYYDITSNIAHTTDFSSVNKRTLAATVSGLGPGWALTVTPTKPTINTYNSPVDGAGLSTPYTFANQATSQTFYTGIGNVVAKDLAITYQFDAETGVNIPAHATNKVVEVAYTLSDD
ncbi:MAG: hypothetical protein WAQ53_06715 [Thiofilum sp.]|uniref:hypothetical protein n=1 Tax=Thiofilum sp. TaxID=2212733 RepID=UPI0025F9D00B|nr:hypothetical protein [Thiofilum sp.]MBK8455028.1 hypothetical protein [Thiofilum sp.]